MRTRSNPLFEMEIKRSLLKAQEATGKAHMTMASCRAGPASGTAAVARSMTEGKGRTEKANYEIPH